MPPLMLSPEEQLRFVEQHIELYRAMPPSEVRDRWLATLKACAAAMRARAPGAAGSTRRILGEKVAAIVRAPNQSLGFQSGKLIALGQEVVGRWRTIEAALEVFSAIGGPDLEPEKSAAEFQK